MTAVPKMRSCRYTGLFMKPPMPTETAECSTYDRSTCFYKSATVNGVEVPRFTKITDPEVIARLDAIKAHMYPDP
jgi:hypothetical protein